MTQTAALTTETQSFLESAHAVLGDKGFTQDPERVDPWLTDWRGRYTGRALALVSPANTAQVAQIVALCARHSIPIVPQGGNSGMSGGATPSSSGDGVLLSLRRMTTIRSMDTDAGQVVCEAGVILQTLHEAAAAQGLRFPLTLGGKGSATIGGLISTNAGGTQVLRYGPMRAQVLGIEAVTADGQVFDQLTALKKDNRGFDLKQLLIGSEGTLGIVTAATLRLLPAQSGRATAWVGLGSITDARALLRRLQISLSDTLEGFEVIPAHCLDSVLAHLPDAKAPLEQRHEWNALIELAGSGDDDHQLQDKLQKALIEVHENAVELDAIIAANDRQSENLWTLRDSISAAERALGPAMQHDISVPVEHMPEFILAAIPALEQEFAGTTGVAFGHLGDGNVHFHILAPSGAVPGVWENDQGKRISQRVHDLVTQWGGSISAEHGIGQMKVDELGRLGDPVALSIMRKVKTALDPDNILNPGKLIPEP